jgi:hypothetical protein
MVISTSAPDKMLRFVAYWWRRQAADAAKRGDRAERDHYATGVAQIEQARKRRLKVAT